MSLATLALLATPHVTLPACAWDRPGHNRFTGDVVAAVRHYADIPAPVASRLQQRMLARDFDDMVEIRRDSIEGRYRYEPDLRDMHFGSGQICRTTTRADWGPAALERGMVYCEAGHCLIVPTVCGNLSRVTRVPPEPGEGSEAVAGAPAATSAAALSMLVPDQTLEPASTPGGASFDDGVNPPGGLTSPSATGESMASDVVAGSTWVDDRYTTTLPAPEGRGPGGPAWAGWPSVVDSDSGAAGLFKPRAPGVVVLPSPVTPVPEPSTALLGALGLAALWARRRLGCRPDHID